MTLPRALAGISFEVVPTPVEPTLPRMDVAGFVGFAASGPVGLPVGVEDPLRFRDIFGRDLALAWDDVAGRLQRSLLGRAVEAFFSNGGVRAWVVRIAGPDAAARRFSLPGLRDSGNGAPAAFVASSPGTWADALWAEAELDRRRLPAPPGSRALTLDGTVATLRLSATPDRALPGDLLELVLPGESLVGYLAVVAVEPAATGLLARCAAPAWAEPASTGATELVPVSAAAGTARYQAWEAASPGPVPAARLLRLILRARIGDGPERRIDDLGLGEAHPRWFGNLPDDAARLGLAPNDLPRDIAREAFQVEAAKLLFPLAGERQQDAAASNVYLPYDLPERRELSAQRDGADGLNDFAADIFLDEDLRGTSARALAGEAEEKASFRNQRLAGLHALWPVREVALLAVPDAVHRHWWRTAAPVDTLLGAPVLSPPVDVAGDGPAAALQWTAVPGATSYVIEQASEPEFLVPTAVRETGLTLTLPLQSPCPRIMFFRVRGEARGVRGPWSNTRGDRLPVEDALPCAQSPIRHLTLTRAAAGSAGDTVGLRWNDETSPGQPVPVQMQAAFDAAFTEPQTVFRGSGTEWPTARPTGAARYFRARIDAAGGPHPWSITMLVPPVPGSQFTPEPPRSYTDRDLLAIQRAALRFAAARADLTVALSLPEHYRETEALAHVDALLPAAGAAATDVVAQVPPLTAGERPVLTYGALYHPWLLGRSDDEGIVPLSPDGATLGTAAATARQDGAWRSQANRPFAETLGLTATYDAPSRLRLEAARVNPVIRDPRGFLFRSDSTLSTDTNLCHMNVRRLMILLRRLAVHEGQVLVFEPFDATFAAQVQRRMERVLKRLYLRGAFRGATAAEAFVVIADDAINPPSSRERGRFIVELRVAPAWPLAFLRVRLVQRDSGALVLEEPA